MSVTVVVVVLIAGGTGWVLAGPPNGVLPAWTSWSLPQDVSDMQLSESDRFALVTDTDDLPVMDLTSIDLANGTSRRYKQDIGLSYSAAFITDDGISGIIDSDSVSAYDRDGHRLWRLPLDDFEQPEREAVSQDTVVVGDECSKGSSQVLGIDIRTGKIRWRSSVTCNFHSYGMGSPTMVQIPTDPLGKKWAVKAVADGTTIRTFDMHDLRSARGRLLMSVEDDRMVATRYPAGTQEWSAEVCPRSAGYDSLSGGFTDRKHQGDGNRSAAVIVTCGDDSAMVVDSRNGRHAPLPKGMDTDSSVQVTDTTLIGVQQDGNQVVATDLLTGDRLWSRKKPAGSVRIDTTPKYVVLSFNDQSRNTFTVVNLSTGKERAHSPGWGNWWAGSGGDGGVWVTHGSLCSQRSQGSDCTLHTTYLLN